MEDKISINIAEISKNIKNFKERNNEKITNNGQKKIREALETIRQYIPSENYEEIKLAAKKRFTDDARRRCGRGMGPNLYERQTRAFCWTCDYIISYCKKLEEG